MTKREYRYHIQQKVNKAMTRLQKTIREAQILIEYLGAENRVLRRLMGHIPTPHYLPGRPLDGHSDHAIDALEYGLKVQGLLRDGPTLVDGSYKFEPGYRNGEIFEVSIVPNDQPVFVGPTYADLMKAIEAQQDNPTLPNLGHFTPLD